MERSTGAPVKVFVDTAPLMEKPLAAAAGIGWQGKHTNLVSRDAGSWLFLGAILTAAELEPDEPEEDHCGSCRRCLDVCPTNAFPGPYQLDARRCIAYLTIEHKGHIRPSSARRSATASSAATIALPYAPGTSSPPPREKRSSRRATPRPTRGSPSCWRSTTPRFRTRYAGTPVKRTGRDRVVRNALIAAGNSGDASLIPLIMPLLSDGSSLVRAMAVWALRRLGEPEVVHAAKTKIYPRETDEAVRNEWHIEIRDEQAFLLRPRLQRRGAGTPPCREAAGRSQAPRARPTRQRTSPSLGYGAYLFDGATDAMKGVAKASRRDATRASSRRAPATTAIPRSCILPTTSLAPRTCNGSAISRPSASMATRAAPGSMRRTRLPGDLRARQAPDQSRTPMAGFRRRDGQTRADLPSRRHLRSGPQRHRRPASKARRAASVKPGQVFNRIHVEDIANVLIAATAGGGQHAIYNVTDNEPAPPQDVIAFAAELLGMEPPARAPVRNGRPLADGAELLFRQPPRQ